METIVDSNPLFKNLFYWLKLYGIELEYKKDRKSILNKVFGIFTFSIVCMIEVFFIYNGIFGHLSIVDMAEVVCSTSSVLNAIIKLTVFWARRKKLIKLIETVAKSLNSGESLNPESLNRIAGVGKVLFKSYLILAFLTSTFYVIGALYKNIFLSSRVLVYNVR